jgi:hypothetical protein
MILFKAKLKSIDEKIFKSFFYEIYFLIIKQLNKFYERKFTYRNIHFFNISKKNKLSRLCEKYGTDKGFINFDKKNHFPGNHTLTAIFIIIYLILLRIKLN